MWARIMRERFGARDARSMMLRFHTQTGGSTLTAQQPDNNIVRVAVQTLAAVLGGTQSLHTNSRDEALALPSEHAVRIALRTQQIVANESGVTGTVDPLAGSYYVEELTDMIENQAMEHIGKIDSLGGMVRAIEDGYPQRQIQESAYTCQREIEDRERIVVGVNSYTTEEPPPEGLLRVDPSVEKAQYQRLSSIRDNRDNGEVSGRLRALADAAAGPDNLMPFILDAVRSYATLGEICGVLRDEFGEYTPQTVL
jgi:methylmalonyl-CoA mutase N-terminal domain/subunit